MSKKIIAVIPVKENSERVKNKNFRKFYKNLSLFQIKLIQLVRSKQFDRIIVSSDSLDARKISAKYNGVEFYYREKKFCNNKISWSNVINEVLDGKEINKEDIISWCHVTSPFFKNYKSMLEKFKKCKKNDSMLTLQENKSFILNENLKPINYQFGKWHDYSQNLPKYYYVNGACFCIKKKNIDNFEYLIGKNPAAFLCNDIESIDIDNINDFNSAKLLFNEKYL